MYYASIKYYFVEQIKQIDSIILPFSLFWWTVKILYKLGRGVQPFCTLWKKLKRVNFPLPQFPQVNHLSPSQAASKYPSRP